MSPIDRSGAPSGRSTTAVGCTRRSAPVQKCFPVAVSTITRTRRSELAVSSSSTQADALVAGHGVALVGPVQRDRAHAALELVEQICLRCLVSFGGAHRAVTVSVSRPERSVTPGDAPVALPSTTIVDPVHEHAHDAVRAGRQPGGVAGQVAHERGGSPTRPSPDRTRTTSAIAPSREHAAVREPEQLRRARRSSAAPPARARRAGGRGCSRRGTASVYGAPHMRSRCAPASQPPSIDRGIVPQLGGAAPTRRSSSSGGAGHSTVRSSSAITMSSNVPNDDCRRARPRCRSTRGRATARSPPRRCRRCV